MSVRALQRVVVRMLYDPALVARVYDDAATALPDAPLRESERSWLTAADRRAYGIDPYRRARTLQGLVEEYPVSCALALSRGASWSQLGDYFSGELFHEAVQRGRSLALVFGGHLLELAGALAEREPWLEPLVRLERGLARVRRRVSHSSGRADDWCLSPDVETLELPRGTVAQHQLVLGRLGEPEQVDLERVTDRRALAGLELGASNGGREYQLLSRNEDGTVRIEMLSPELFAILETTRGGVGHRELVEVCRALGAEDDQIESILQDFTESGELVPPESGPA